MSTDLLFVYGTLRRGCDTAHAHGLEEACDWAGPARVQGRLYRIAWYPGFVFDPLAGWVTGDLLRMRDPAAVLAGLDLYEETGPGVAEPQEYRREIIEVERQGSPVEAWVYLYNRPVEGASLIASGDWLRP
ncbi:MAG: gamma-glutamylcyclotransferase [Sphingobium sp.]